MKTTSMYLLALFMSFAGVMHFVRPEFFLRLMPPYLPFHKGLVFWSGVFEVVLGILLLVPGTSRAAAWGIIALLIAVFPANIHVYQNQHLLPAPSLVHILRLPLQAVFIVWAFWHTRP